MKNTEVAKNSVRNKGNLQKLQHDFLLHNNNVYISIYWTELFKYGLIVEKTCTKNISSVRRKILKLYDCLNKSKNPNEFVYTTQLEYSKITSDEKKLLVMIRYWYTTYPRMIYQQDPIVRMFVSYKIHKNARTNFL